jgi:starch synthase
VQSVILIAKVGGLACCRCITKINAGHKARVVVPSYDKFIKENDFESVHLGHVKLGSFLIFHILKEKKIF